MRTDGPDERDTRWAAGRFAKHPLGRGGKRRVALRFRPDRSKQVHGLAQPVATNADRRRVDECTQCPTGMIRRTGGGRARRSQPMRASGECETCGARYREGPDLGWHFEPPDCQ
jgi:hypothetical protein